MKDYASMSDFEINKAVAEALGYEAEYDDYADCLMVCSRPEVKTYHPNLQKINTFDSGSITHAIEFDPCNNPSDAWPIISNNKIDLIWDSGYRCYLPSRSRNIYTKSVDTPATNKTGPFRHAMVFYLMMMEEQE